MQITILQENLLTTLKNVTSFAPSSAQLPLLENILLIAEKNNLHIFATDLSIGIRKTTRAKVEKEGRACIKPKTLLAFVSQLPAGKVNLFLKGKQLLLTTANAQAEFNTTAADEFPVLKPLINGQKIKPAEINAIAREVSFAAATDEGRIVLTGVKIEKKAGKERIIATDGFRLSIKQMDRQIFKTSAAIILPARLFGELARLIPKTETAAIGIEEQGGTLVLAWRDTLINAQLIEGEYPDIDKILPARFATRVILDRERFARQIMMAAVFARESANVIRLLIKQNQVEVSANSVQIGKNKTNSPAKTTGKAVATAFNYRFLSDFLKSTDADEIIFETEGELKPGVFRAKGNREYLHIIMPVRVQN